jgi:hypothetical protein
MDGLRHRMIWTFPVMVLAGCGGDPVGPEADVTGFYSLESVDGRSEGWAVSDPGSPVLIEIYESSIDLRHDQSCVLQRSMSELDMTDPDDWVQTVVQDWTTCSYTVEGGDVRLSFAPPEGGPDAHRITPFLFPQGGTLTASFRSEDHPRGDNVYVHKVLSLMEDGRRFVYTTEENSSGGGPCILIC